MAPDAVQKQNGNGRSGPLSAFVSFPSPYTQTLLIQALVATLESISISVLPPDEADPPQLQWADYDLMTFDKAYTDRTRYLTSSYVYRKALIRKHQLHLTITEYLAKYRSRAELALSRTSAAQGEGYAAAMKEVRRSPLDDGGVPRGWVIELLGVDDLDELLMDELYELQEEMRANEAKSAAERTWFILKPGFADRAQGIRMFSTEDELTRIFESFESDSEDEEYEEDDDDSDEEKNEGDEDAAAEDVASGAAKLSVGDSDTQISVDEQDNGGDEHEQEVDQEEEDEDEEERGTGVMTSQLRFFIIQEYMPRPVLFDYAQIPEEPPVDLTGYKFHLRAYVLVTGSYTVHISRTMLALFAGSPYVHPGAKVAPGKDDDDATSAASSGGEIDLQPHLTNTCLQTDAYGAPTPPEELVKLFWELEGMDALALPTRSGGSDETAYEKRGKVSREWLDGTFARVGEVVAESVKAGVECGSFGLQLVPNAFEIFGVDLLLSYPADTAQPSSTAGTSGGLPIPLVTLLEYNASPDFHQSGDRLKTDLAEMFRGVVRLSVAPFFGLDVKPERTERNGREAADADSDDEDGLIRAGEMKTMEVGEEKWGWRLVGKGEIRSFGA